jgi:hypothetical protein
MQESQTVFQTVEQHEGRYTPRAGFQLPLFTGLMDVYIAGSGYTFGGCVRCAIGARNSTSLNLRIVDNVQARPPRTPAPLETVQWGGGGLLLGSILGKDR